AEPVRRSGSTGDGGAGHCRLTRRPFPSTNSEASPVRAWSSPTFLATSTPLALRQGPMPIRLRASTGPPPLAGSCSALRYARHSWPPAPAAVANRWHRASAPPQPPRFSVLLRELETKKVIGPLGFEGIVLSFAPQLATRTQSNTGEHFFIARLESWCWRSAIFSAPAARTRLPSRSPAPRTMRGTPGAPSRLRDR